VAEVADDTHARIELIISANLWKERIVASVVGTYVLSQTAVAGRAASPFDPTVLIRRYGLGGELSSKPVGLFCKRHSLAQAQRCQGSRYTAQTAAHDEDVRR
jgi:hypothetical protein